MDNKNVKVLLLECFARQTMVMMEFLHKDGYHLTTYNSRKTDLGYLSHYPDKKILAPWNRESEEESAAELLKVLQADHFKNRSAGLFREKHDHPGIISQRQ